MELELLALRSSSTYAPPLTTAYSHFETLMVSTAELVLPPPPPVPPEAVAGVGVFNRPIAAPNRTRVAVALINSFFIGVWFFNLPASTVLKSFSQSVLNDIS